jgi:hypothetical protein
MSDQKQPGEIANDVSRPLELLAIIECTATER